VISFDKSASRFDDRRLPCTLRQGQVGFFFIFPHRARAAFRAISRRRSGVSFAARARPPFGPPAFPPREPISRRYSRIVSRPLATKPDSIAQEPTSSVLTP